LAHRAEPAIIRGMMNRADRMAALLQLHFTPQLLQIVDDSGRHAGHAGAAPGGETHYRILMVSAVFSGLSRIERSRRVHAALDDELSGGLHAVTLSLRTPEEHAAPKRVRD
jgi:stress-induced morphogen